MSRGGKREGSGRKKLKDSEKKKTIRYLGQRFSEEQKEKIEKEIKKIIAEKKISKAMAVYMRMIKEI